MGTHKWQYCQCCSFVKTSIADDVKHVILENRWREIDCRVILRKQKYPLPWTLLIFETGLLVFPVGIVVILDILLSVVLRLTSLTTDSLRGVPKSEQFPLYHFYRPHREGTVFAGASTRGRGKLPHGFWSQVPSLASGPGSLGWLLVPGPFFGGEGTPVLSLVLPWGVPQSCHSSCEGGLGTPI